MRQGCEIGGSLAPSFPRGQTGAGRLVAPVISRRWAREDDDQARGPHEGSLEWELPAPLAGRGHGGSDVHLYCGVVGTPRLGKRTTNHHRANNDPFRGGEPENRTLWLNLEAVIVVHANLPSMGGILRNPALEGALSHVYSPARTLACSRGITSGSGPPPGDGAASGGSVATVDAWPLSAP